MSRPTLLSRLSRSSSLKRTRETRRRRWFERLEDRRVLAYDVTLLAGVLTLSESGGTDNSALQLQVTGGNYEFSDPGVQFDQNLGAGSAVAGNTLSVPTAGVTSIVLNLITGNDTLTINGPAITTLAPINFTSANAVSSINSTVTLAAGNLQFTTSGTLAANATLTATTGNVVLSASANSLGNNVNLSAPGAGGSVSVTGPLTIGAAGTNNISAGTTIGLPITGDGAGTGSLIVSAGTVATLAAIDIDGAFTASGTTINVNGSIQADAGINLTGAVVLANNVNLTSSAANITVTTGPLTIGTAGTNTIDGTTTVSLPSINDGAGTGSLTLSPTATLTLADFDIDGTLTATATTINVNGSIQADTGINLTGAVVLANNVNLTSSAANITVTTGPLTIGTAGTNTIDGTTTVSLPSINDGAGTGSLTLSPTATFTLVDVDIDGTLTATATTINVNGSIQADTGINLTGAVVLANNVNLTSSAANITVTTGPLTIGTAGTNTIDGTTTVSLPSINDGAGTGSLTLSPTATLTLADVDIDGTLTASATTINVNGSIQADTGINLTGDVTLANNVNLTSLNANVTVTTGPLTIGSAGTNTIAAGTTVSLPSTDDAGAASLTITATTSATLADVTIDGTLSVTSPTININGDASATTGITLAGVVNLAQNVDLTATNGNVTVTVGPVNLGNGGISSISAGNTHVVDLPATTDGAGSAALTVIASTINLHGDVGADNGITLTGAVNLSTNVDLTATGGNVTVSGGTLTLGNGGTNIVTAGNANVASLPSTIDGAGTASLTVLAGTATLADVTIDGTLTVTAPTINMNGDAAATAGIGLTGTVNLAQNVDLGASGGNVTVANGPLNLGDGGTNIISAGSIVNLANALDNAGTASLSVIATTATLAGVGIDGALGVTAPTINVNGDASAAVSITLAGLANLATNVDLTSSNGNVVVTGALRLIGAGGANTISSGNDVELALVTDNGAGTPSTFSITADHNITLSSILLNTAPTSVTINVDQDTGDALGGDLSAGTINAGTVTINSNSNETITANITSTLAAGFINITLTDTNEAAAELQSSLTIASNITLSTAATGSIAISTGDNIVVNTGVKLLAGNTLTMSADAGSVDPLGASLSFAFDPLDIAPAEFGQLSASSGTTINGNTQGDTLSLPVNWLTPGQATIVNMGSGDDRVTLKYPANFSGPADTVLPLANTNLTINSQGGIDTLDVDASLDTAPRQIQYTYQNSEGTNVTLLTDTSAGGVTNVDSLNIVINGNEKYLARGGSNAQDDQFVIVGQAAVSNFITIADIANNGTPGVFADDTVANNKRFGVQGFEFIRAIGGNKTDGIRVDVSTGAGNPGVNPSGAMLVLIEGNGGDGALYNDDPSNSTKLDSDPLTGLGERLIGSLTIPNIIVGAGVNNSPLPANGTDVPLLGVPGPDPTVKIGKDPSRAIIAGGNISNLLLPDYRLQIKAINDQTLLEFEEINTPGSFIDVLQGSNSVTVVQGNERAGTRTGAGGGCGENIFIGGEPTSIDVCSWLLARFPTDSGINLLINPMGGANAQSPLARQRIENVDLTILVLSGNGQPEPGSTTPQANSPQTLVTLPSTIVAGHATTMFLQSRDPATGLSVPGAVFEIDINGDGSLDAQVSDPTGEGISVPVTFDHSGVSALRVTAISPTGVAGPKHRSTVSVQTSGIVNGDLLIGGTAGNDQILLLADAAGVRVRLNGQQLGPYTLDAAATIRVAGLAGNDQLIAGRNIHQSLELSGGAGNDVLYGGTAADALLGGEGRDYLFGEAGQDLLDGGTGDDRIYGGDGDDRLQGGDGDDVLLGNLGSDQLYGQQGRDVLIGGLGRDLIVGGASEDILIGGTTTHDGDEQSLIALLTAWKQNVDVTSRIQTISDPNFAAALNQLTVLDDEASDTLFGEAGDDWFFVFADDLVA